MLDRTRNDNIRELFKDTLFALQNPMKLDGRVSSYPASARGYSVTNCYVLRQPDAAWLIDTGVWVRYVSMLADGQRSQTYAGHRSCRGPPGAVSC